MADTKLTGLAAIAAAASEDLLYMVDDPGGTPAEKKATLDQVLTLVKTDTGIGLYSVGATDVPVADGGTGRSTGTTAYALIAAGTTATAAQQTLAAGATTEILVGGGAAAVPVWTTATGTGSPVRATSPTLTTPALGTPASGVITNCTGSPTLTSVKFATGNGIADDSANEQIKFVKTASAVNEISVTNAATGNAPSFTATGGDTNINLALAGKGTGRVLLDGFQTGMHYLEGGALAAATSHLFGVDAYSAYHTIKIIFYNIKMTSDASKLNIRLSDDDGATLEAGLAYYAWSYFLNFPDATTYYDSSDSSDSEFTISDTYGNDTDEAGHFEVTLKNRLSATYLTLIEATSSVPDPDGLPSGTYASGAAKAAATHNGLGIVPSAGNVSGSYAMYGML